jgi:SAM-dependent methyltransferase
VAVPPDYDADPDRYRLGLRVTESFARPGANLYRTIAGALAAAGARTVLDIGCGEGVLGAAVADAGVRVVGLDRSATLLASAPRPAVRGDAGALPFATASFDAAVAVNMLYHLHRPADALTEARRVLRPGGPIMVATVSRHDAPEPAHAWRPSPSTFDAEEAAAQVEAIFGNAEPHPWDGPYVTLPDPAAVRDFLIARLVPAPEAEAAAHRVPTPLTLTKRGTMVIARR